MKGTSASSLQVECGELPLDLRREKLMANHVLRSIAIRNESVKTKYFISDGRKSKSQARLHLKMKKPARRYRRGNSHNSSLETGETGDRHLESLLRSRQPTEDSGW